jgi:hypothetical protein
MPEGTENKTEEEPTMKNNTYLGAIFFLAYKIMHKLYKTALFDCCQNVQNQRLEIA